MEIYSPPIGTPRLPISRAEWSMEGGRRLVKVTCMGHVFDAKRARPPGPIGYVTQVRYLDGMTAAEIEAALGLHARQLQHGALIFGLTRLPLEHEHREKGFAIMPGGCIYHGMHKKKSERLAKEGDKFYPPGAWIPQWHVSASIPLTLIMRLPVGARFES